MGHHNHVENAGFLSLLAGWIDSFQMLSILGSKGLSWIRNVKTKPSINQMLPQLWSKTISFGLGYVVAVLDEMVIYALVFYILL